MKFGGENSENTPDTFHLERRKKPGGIRLFVPDFRFGGQKLGCWMVLGTSESNGSQPEKWSCLRFRTPEFHDFSQLPKRGNVFGADPFQIPPDHVNVPNLYPIYSTFISLSYRTIGRHRMIGCPMIISTEVVSCKNALC